MLGACQENVILSPGFTVLGEVTTLNPLIDVVWDRPVVGAYSANRSEIKIVALNVLKSFSIGVPSWETTLLVPASSSPRMSWNHSAIFGKRS